MEYTIKKMAALASITTRTLRYYDEINLLSPSYINSSGYRVYTEKEVDILQQILFYRTMDMRLEEIKQIISQPGFDISKALIEHHQQLIFRRNQLDQLISTVEKTIDHNKGATEMTNAEKFEGFKKEEIAKNESKYGKEIREKYGEEKVSYSNTSFKNLSEEHFKKMQADENNLFQSLKEVMKTNDLDSKAAEDVYKNHKRWLSYSWKSYTKEAHIELAEMYVTDQRFTDYYTKRAGEKTARTLRDIIIKYAK
ncbi:MAG: MerR family transcriptional regulator [Carnobacterium sp.]|nr:MerR family transcriptional regulator [Carnobacterium sp.]